MHDRPVGTKTEYDQLGKPLRLVPQRSVYRQGQAGKASAPGLGDSVLALSMTLDESFSLSGLQSPHLSDERREEENSLSLPALLLCVPRLCEGVLNKWSMHGPRRELGA